MKIRAGYRIAFDCPMDTPFLLKLKVHPDRRADLLTQDDVRVSSGPPVQTLTDEFGNLVTRLVAPAGRVEFSSDFLITASNAPDSSSTVSRTPMYGTSTGRQPGPTRSSLVTDGGQNPMRRAQPAWTPSAKTPG